MMGGCHKYQCAHKQSQQVHEGLRGISGPVRVVMHLDNSTKNVLNAYSRLNPGSATLLVIQRDQIATAIHTLACTSVQQLGVSLSFIILPPHSIYSLHSLLIVVQAMATERSKLKYRMAPLCPACHSLPPTPLGHLGTVSISNIAFLWSYACEAGCGAIQTQQAKPPEQTKWNQATGVDHKLI